MLEGLIQPMHLLLVLAIVLIVFGPGQLPELGKGLGTAVRDFRRALSGGEPDDHRSTRSIASGTAGGGESTAPPSHPVEPGEITTGSRS